MSGVYLIRIEACDFSSTLFDTDDLSTIRGASLAGLMMPTAWPGLLKQAGLDGVSEVNIGASDGIYTVTTVVGIDAIHAAIASALGAPSAAGDALDAVRPYLSFTYAVVPQTADYRRDALHMAALCRQRQLQRPTVDIPHLTKANGACPIDRRRPADTRYGLPGARQPQEVSASVATRRAYGRSARQSFYASSAGAGRDFGFGFADSFQDLIRPLSGVSLPVSLTGKMAVVYLDGNSFTAIREAIVFGPGGSVDAVRARQNDFSEFVRKARRGLLSQVLEFLAGDPHMRFDTDVSESREHAMALKFETLLWGGDESLFVLPAWKLFDLLPVLARALDHSDWVHPSGYTLSHAVGILVCNVKTPISVARSLANTIADASKSVAKAGANTKALSNVYAIQILESIEPPRGDLDAFRNDLYGVKAPRPFTLKGTSEVDQFIKLLRAFQHETTGLPRSQLFKLIGRAKRDKLLRSGQGAAGKAFFDTEVVKSFGRARCTLHPHLTDVALGYSAPAPLLPLIRLAEFWDYCDPITQPRAEDAA